MTTSLNSHPKKNKVSGDSKDEMRFPIPENHLIESESLASSLEEMSLMSEELSTGPMQSEKETIRRTPVNVRFVMD